jgi:hypothetical protein
MADNRIACWTIDVDGRLEVKVGFDAWTDQWQAFNVCSASAAITLHFGFQAWFVSLVSSAFGPTQLSPFHSTYASPVYAFRNHHYIST